MSSSSVSNLLNTLRIVGLLEGVSFLVLLGVAMPLKYLAGMPEVVRVFGWMHGLLFVLFIGVAVLTWRRQRWPSRRLLGAMVASVVPFGTFVLDASLRRDLQALRRSEGAPDGA